MIHNVCVVNVSDLIIVCISGLLASVPTIQEEAEPLMTDESQTSSGPGERAYRIFLILSQIRHNSFHK